ncbi:MAG: ATP-binding cassette domain-containing protein, partial [Burkholderiales bacterium]
MPAETLVEINDLNFSYGQQSILKGMNMRIAKGQVVSIRGGSGCGKTTLLRLIGGQLRPSNGAVKVAGEVIH